MEGMFITAFLLGLLGSAHCIGMCGPLVFAVSARASAPASGWLGMMVMQTGRTAVYVLMGAAAGMFGRGLQLAGAQRTVSIALGTIILVGLIVPKLLPTSRLSRIPATLVIKAQRLFGDNFQRRSLEGVFFMGMLNGLLPCGLVYLALTGGLAQDGLVQGALFMACFGIGTWPALFVVRWSDGLLRGSIRERLRKIAPYAYAAMGILLILRGMDLGVPFVSPDLPEVNSPLDTCATGI